MAEVATQSWTGRSDEIAVPQLGGEFWKEGTEVSGVLEGRRELPEGGSAFKLALDSSVVVDGEEVDVVELPSLTGVKNALQSLREKGYQLRKGDMWRVTCLRIRKAKKADYSDSPQFEIAVIRK